MNKPNVTPQTSGGKCVDRNPTLIAWVLCACWAIGAIILICLFVPWR